jgi:hypothetical protein
MNIVDIYNKMPPHVSGYTSFDDKDIVEWAFLPTGTTEYKLSFPAFQIYSTTLSKDYTVVPVTIDTMKSVIKFTEPLSGPGHIVVHYYRRESKS